MYSRFVDRPTGELPIRLVYVREIELLVTFEDVDYLAIHEMAGERYAIYIYLLDKMLSLYTRELTSVCSIAKRRDMLGPVLGYVFISDYIPAARAPWLGA